MEQLPSGMEKASGTGLADHAKPRKTLLKLWLNI
jgi:hypothetical protein